MRCVPDGQHGPHVQTHTCPASPLPQASLTARPVLLPLHHPPLSHLCAVHCPPPPTGEALIGARAYRVLFALGSLPLATVALVYYINHRYDGTMLWNLRDVTGVHELCWLLSFVSFYFLYPSTFNILEVRPTAGRHTAVRMPARQAGRQRA
jgi:uncharacterized membrane protein